MASIFAPPRNKPKISLPRPTLAAGQPMPQPQTIPEPIHFIGAKTGTHYGTAGDNPNGAEQVSINPPPGPTNDPPGGPSYASGGSFLVGGDPTYGSPGAYDPQNTGEFPVPSSGGGVNQPPGDPNTGEYPVPGRSNWPMTSNRVQSPSGPIYGPPVPQQIPQQTRPSITAVPLQNNYGNPNQSIFGTQQNQMNARNAYLNAQANVLDQRTGLIPLQRGVTAAKGQVISAQEQQNQMQRGYYQQQAGNEQQRQAELEGIYRASQNAPDLLNTANAQNAYSSENRRDAAMGVSAPAEVNLSPGYNGPREAGIRPKIMSQEQRLAEKAGYEDPIRAAKLQAAQTAISLQGTDVRAAELAASKAGLTLEEAQQLVSQAELQSSYAGIISSRAGLETEQAGMEPFPGAVRYTDPQTGEGSWVTPQERDQRNTQYQESVQQPYAAGVRNQGSQYAGLSDAQLLNTIPPVQGGEQQNHLYTEPVRAELVRRYMQQGLNYEQASLKADELIKYELSSRRNAGGGSLALDAAGNPIQSTQISPANPAPASAPTSNNTAAPASGGRYSEYVP